MKRSKDDIIKDLNKMVSVINGYVIYNGFNYIIETPGKRYCAETLKDARDFIRKEIKK